MCAQGKECFFEQELFPADELEIKVIFVFVVVQHSVERFARLSGTRVRFADELHANGVGHVFGGVRHCGDVLGRVREELGHVVAPRGSNGGVTRGPPLSPPTVLP